MLALFKRCFEMAITEDICSVDITERQTPRSNRAIFTHVISSNPLVSVQAGELVALDGAEKYRFGTITFSVQFNTKQMSSSTSTIREWKSDEKTFESGDS